MKNEEIETWINELKRRTDVQLRLGEDFVNAGVEVASRIEKIEKILSELNERIIKLDLKQAVNSLQNESRIEVLEKRFREHINNDVHKI